MRRMFRAITLLAACTLAASALAQEAAKASEPARYVNEMQRAWYRLSADPIYKTTYPTRLVKLSATCATATAADAVTVPATTYLRESTQTEPDADGNRIVHVYEIPDMAGVGEAKIRADFFSTPFRMCAAGNVKVMPEFRRRTGGLNTGMLVVPFKLRKGDIYGDSAIGPYVAYSVERWELLATAGLSQISTVETGGTDIKNESGLTIALGLKFQIKKDWSIALIVGADHLSGQPGRDWKYQDKAWVSFAIGFDFSQ